MNHVPARRTSRPERRIHRRLIVAAVWTAATVAAAQVPPPPIPLGPPPQPTENPITESKRVLGKILFWDEQLSSDDTVACGSCHDPLHGGGDARLGVNPGPDGTASTPDDVIGSPGVARTDEQGRAVEDPVFGLGAQVTPRSANAVIGAAYPPELFWDGRASTTFVDPQTGGQSIAIGGALESQAVAPILNDVEMARSGRTWDEVIGKLEHSLPLTDATDLPDDVAAALDADPGYPELFDAAFGDPAITAERIAFAVATYERTLVPDQTPWDAFIAGDLGAMTPGQVQGWDFFRTSPCSGCHLPPTFTNHSFHAIGMRPPGEDPGRQDVTGLVQDRGRFKVPTLRNVGLKATHMHTGALPTVTDAVLWYRPNNPDRAVDNLDPALPVGVPPDVLPALVDFLSNALTDPRVAAGSFPFDRPTLHGGALPALDVGADRSTLSWPALAGVQRYNVYRGDLADLPEAAAAGYGACVSDSDADPADTSFSDPAIPAPGHGFFYLKSVVDGTDAERGLGATSTGTPRTVLVGCADMGTFSISQN